MEQLERDFFFNRRLKKPDLQDLATHFAGKGQAGWDSTVLNEVKGTSYVECLDKDVTTDEIKSGMKNLKEEKSSLRLGQKDTY